jgi:hypothetical protein
LAFLKDSGDQAFRVLHYVNGVWWVTATWLYMEEQIAGWWPLPEVPGHGGRAQDERYVGADDGMDVRFWTGRDQDIDPAYTVR